MAVSGHADIPGVPRATVDARGTVPLGSLLLEINGVPCDGMSFDEQVCTLRELSDARRELRFQVSPLADDERPVTSSAGMPPPRPGGGASTGAGAAGGVGAGAGGASAGEVVGVGAGAAERKQGTEGKAGTSVVDEGGDGGETAVAEGQPEEDPAHAAARRAELEDEVNRIFFAADGDSGDGGGGEEYDGEEAEEKGAGIEGAGVDGENAAGGVPESAEETKARGKKKKRRRRKKKKGGEGEEDGGGEQKSAGSLGGRPQRSVAAGGGGKGKKERGGAGEAKKDARAGGSVARRGSKGAGKGAGKKGAGKKGGEKGGADGKKKGDAKKKGTGGAADMMAQIQKQMAEKEKKRNELDAKAAEKKEALAEKKREEDKVDPTLGPVSKRLAEVIGDGLDGTVHVSVKNWSYYRQMRSWLGGPKMRYRKVREKRRESTWVY